MPWLRRRRNLPPLSILRNHRRLLTDIVRVVVQEKEGTGLSAESLDDILAGTDYRAVGRLGKGGMGDVYVVEHPGLGRKFALKLLRSELLHDRQFADRMRVEAQAAARLQHPNIVEVVDFWLTRAGSPCFVMQLLQGKTLGQELAAKRRLAVDDAIDLTQQALSGLAAAHSLGVVHRDITPENLFLHEVPRLPRTLKILDFGLARVLPGASRQAPDPLALPTKTGALVGSPRFMSPEAARRERVDHRADLFSVGVILYVMLTGHGPHDVRAARVAVPSALGEGIEPRLDAIVLRAIEERLEDRYQTADEFLRALSGLSRASKRPPASH